MSLGRPARGRLAALLAIAALSAGFAVWSPGSTTPHIDHAINRDAAHLMRDGAGYYDAMDRSLRAHIGPAETVRAFRTPPLFLLWSRIPDGWLWPAFAASAGVAGALVLGITPLSLAGPAVTLYLLRLGRLGGSPPLDRFLLVEFWVVPMVAASLAAWRGRRWWPAAALAAVATVTRELAVVLLAGGLLAAHRGRGPRAPWLVATGLAAAALGAHAAAASAHLVENGTENPLFLTGSLWAVAETMGFGLPAGAVVGPPLWALAAWRLHTVGDWDDAALFLLALPFLGLLFDRSGWGALLVPFTMAWAAEGAVLLVRRRRSAERGGT